MKWTQADRYEPKLSTDPFGPRGGFKFGKSPRGPERMPEGIRLGEFYDGAQVVCAAPWPGSAWAYGPASGWALIQVLQDGYVAVQPVVRGKLGDALVQLQKRSSS